MFLQYLLNRRMRHKKRLQLYTIPKVIVRFLAGLQFGVFIYIAVSGFAFADSAANSPTKPTTQLVAHRIPGHCGTASCFSRDGRRIMIAGLKQVAVLDSSTLQQIGKPLHFDGSITAATINPNGTHMAVCIGSEISIWDIERSKSVLTLKKNTGSVSDLVYSDDGKLIAGAGPGKRACIWSASSGLMVKTLSHDDDVRSVEFDTDGTMLLTSTLANIVKDDKNHVAKLNVHLWNVESGRRKWTIENCSGRPVFSPNGELVGVPEGVNGAMVCDTQKGEAVARWQSITGVRGVTSICFDKSGKFVLIAGDDGQSVVESSARVFQIKKSENSQTYDLDEFRGFAPNSEIARASISPNGQFVALVSMFDRSKTAIWNVNNGKMLFNIYGDAPEDQLSIAQNVVFKSDSSRLLVTYFVGPQDSSLSYTMIWSIPAPQHSK